MLVARLPGQYYDQETGLHHNYFRDYDPSLGRYLQSDPIGLGDGPNTYIYVWGNPVNYYDPYGLFSMDDIWGAVYWSTGGWSPDQSTVNFAAGFGDAVWFGATKYMRKAGGFDNVNYCSKIYTSGGYVGTAIGVLGGGAGLLKTYQKRSKAKQWRSNSKTSRKTRAKKIKKAGNYKVDIEEGFWGTYAGSEGVDSWNRIVSGNYSSMECGCEK